MGWRSQEKYPPETLLPPVYRMRAGPRRAGPRRAPRQAPRALRGRQRVPRAAPRQAPRALRGRQHVPRAAPRQGPVPAGARFALKSLVRIFALARYSIYNDDGDTSGKKKKRRKFSTVTRIIWLHTGFPHSCSALIAIAPTVLPVTGLRVRVHFPAQWRQRFVFSHTD